MKIAKNLYLYFTILLPLLFSLPTFADISYANFESDLSGFSNSGVKQFSRKSGLTPTNNTGPNGGAGSNFYVFMETSSGGANTSGDTAYLSASGITGTSVSFYYHMYGANIGLLAFEVYYNSNWVRVWQVEGQQQPNSNAAWIKQNISLAFYPGSKSVRFAAIAKGGELGDIALDEIQFSTANSTTLNYGYDALGRVICVEDPTNGNRDFDYDDAGNRTNVSIGVCNG